MSNHYYILPGGDIAQNIEEAKQSLDIRSDEFRSLVRKGVILKAPVNQNLLSFNSEIPPKKVTRNLFADWKHGQVSLPKVYMVRIHYIDNQGNSGTLLKLGHTRQPLHERIIDILYVMRKATGFEVKNYELVSLVYTQDYVALEHAFLRDREHLYFYNAAGAQICFPGYTEMFKDTPENCNLMQYPDSYYHRGHRLIPYNYRVNFESRNFTVEVV